MKLNAFHIFSFLFGILTLTNIFKLWTDYLPVVGDFLALFTFLVTPGILLLFVLKLPLQSLWEKISYGVGLSLSFLMVGGLFINQFFPYIGIVKPLALVPMLTGFDILFLPLFIFAYLRNKNLSLTFAKPQITKHTLIFSSYLSFLPLLSTLGAISLNNGETNIFTMIMLGGIGIYIFLLTLFRKKVSSFIFPTSLYFIGLSLLLMTSLRSWFIAGHDIVREYYVFALTKSHLFWSMNFYNDAYNAMLSITILPTILSQLVHFDDIYIYKLIFQILFAVCPVIVYLFFKKFANSITAFLATMCFLIFPTFYTDMPFLNRQEIGFIFFGLILLLMFDRFLKTSLRNILFVIFGFSIIIAHYSTTYVLISILLLTYVLSKIISHNYFKIIIKKLFSHPRISIKKSFSTYQYITGFMIISLLVLTYFWNSQVTKTNDNITNTFQKIVYSTFISSKNDSKSSDLIYSLFFSHKVDEKEQFQEYIQTSITESRKNNDIDDFYPAAVYAKYKISLVSQPQLPLTPLGTLLTNAKISVLNLNLFSRQFIAQIIQVLIFIGLFLFLIHKKTKIYNKEYILLSMSSIILLGLGTILPQASVEYGLLRMFEQLLMLLSLPIILAIFFITSFLKKSQRVIIAGSIIILFFYTLTGFFSMLTGGYYPSLNLTNKGLYYLAYYSEKNNVVSAEWLSANRDRQQTVQTDHAGVGKLLTFGNIYAVNEILPPVIKHNSYVYLTNTQDKNNPIVVIDKAVFVFNQPTDFLSDNKNLIYNNGGSKIYK